MHKHLYPRRRKAQIQQANRYILTNYAADVEALVYGIAKAEQHRGECKQVAIFTVAKSVLETRAGDKLPDLTRKLKKPSQCHRVVLQRITAHIFQRLLLNCLSLYLR
ncbi:hypothetical protein RRG08_024686 [Elysia crispata]|uniref:Uncharacterized protein n=1 Tax=Elysia crispata TaxID=231223 RepID=A0AAE1CWX1_9GAST|nr:hypothetical protein RRG08_024686 [Elysia crispata]